MTLYFRELYNKFANGDFAIRRTENFFSGISADLTIEQTLMRSLKSRSGLTRGGGLSEVRRNVWLQAAPTVATIKNDLRSCTGVRRESSEQHKDVGLTKKERDVRNAYEFVTFLVDRNPFHMEEEGVVNLGTGEVTIKVLHMLEYFHY